MHRGQAAPASLEEAGVGRRASWVTQYQGIEGAIRMRNYSPKALATYRLWMRKFQSLVRSNPADELDGEDAKAFLTDLAVRQGVAASTQNQAFNALLFYYPACAAQGVRKARWGGAGQAPPLCAGGAFAFGGQC